MDKSNLKGSFSRREVIKSAGLATLGMACLSGPLGRNAAAHSAKDLLLYVGTYTGGKSEGIYIYRLDLSTGGLRPVGVAKGVANPSYLALDAQNRYLYAVNEVSELGGKPTGGVTAFAVDRQTGELRKLNQQASEGTSPCYVTVHPSGKFVLVANYSSGTVAVLPIKGDGSLDAAVEVVQHRGAGANPRRQDGPHAHCIRVDPSGRFAFAADLGIDKVMIYRFDAEQGKLAANSQPFVQAKPGAGPRHLDFHPGGKFAYVINELDSSLTALSYQNAGGELKALQTVSTLPRQVLLSNTCADVHVHPSGRFVYGSNRGHNSIVAFAIEERTGNLTYLAHESTQGKTPRNFVIDPTGTFLLVANQNSGTVVTFRIERNGRLVPAGQVAQVPTPVCLKFI
ncbi:MAG TPA: lactonase family protein [Blastocatellia bacterium]|nr:lactonase family protein [Blastocatellia bacterium]